MVGEGFLPFYSPWNPTQPRGYICGNPKWSQPAEENQIWAARHLQLPWVIAHLSLGRQSSRQRGGRGFKRNSTMTETGASNPSWDFWRSQLSILSMHSGGTEALRGDNWQNPMGKRIGRLGRLVVSARPAANNFAYRLPIRPLF